MEIKITSAEFKVVSLIEEGYSNQEIASALYLSVRTVEHHVLRLYRLADVCTRSKLMHWLKFNSFEVNQSKQSDKQSKIDLACQLKCEGKSIRQIAKILSVHYGTAYNYTKRNQTVAQCDVKHEKCVEGGTEIEIITAPPKMLCYFWGT